MKPIRYGIVGFGVQGRAYAGFLLSRLTLQGNQVIFLLVPEHLYELHSGIHVIRRYGKHLFEGRSEERRVGKEC